MMAYPVDDGLNQADVVFRADEDHKVKGWPADDAPCPVGGAAGVQT